MANLLGFCKTVYQGVLATKRTLAEEELQLDPLTENHDAGGSSSEAEAYLQPLRPVEALQKPTRLPDTPTKSHQPPSRPKRAPNGRLTKKCPHCNEELWIDRKSFKVMKPSARKGIKKAPKSRWISVWSRRGSEEALVEDLSPRYTPRGKKKRGVRWEEDDVRETSSGRRGRRVKFRY